MRRLLLVALAVAGLTVGALGPALAGPQAGPIDPCHPPYTALLLC